MEIMDASVPAYFNGPEMLLSEYYNPLTGRVSGTGGSDASIWKYTAAIEAVNAILHGLIAHKEHGNASLYDENFDRYSVLLEQLYSGAAYYKGTYELTSFTQTREWSVYAVPRGNTPGGANPGGDNHKFNVYDDQMWLIRELILAYKATGKAEYLEEAEYLTAYVLDGWDCTLDANGIENGGIPWGPGYVTKHACSNGPMISPLVWLHELYKDRSDEITYGYIEGDGRRATRTVKKSECYLDFAQRIYEWEKSTLLRSDGVYHDMRGGCDTGSGGLGCDPRFETVDGVRYKANSPLTRSEGTAYTYNAGTMLSGASDLYRVTGREIYRTDLDALSEASFRYFATPASINGYRYIWPMRSGWTNWFTGVLFRGYMDASEATSNPMATDCLDSFQENLDYSYGKHFREGFLPVDLLAGWNSNPADSSNSVNVMATCMFVTEYAMLARRELEQ